VTLGAGSLVRTTLASQFAQSDLIIAGVRSTAMAAGCWRKVSHAKLRIGMNHPQGGEFWLTAEDAGPSSAPVFAPGSQTEGPRGPENSIENR
jgi:hypothetical protein